MEGDGGQQRATAADRQPRTVQAVAVLAQAQDPPVPPQYVRLDVGGTRYTTLLSTLCKYPGSMLATMFEGLEDEPEEESGPTIGLAKDVEGTYILDRDGPLFRHVLNYLRHEGEGEAPLPFGEEDRWLLAMEADYYMLPELAQECRAGCGRAGPLDMSGSVLTGRDFSGRDLSYANLSGSNLNNADFSQADLTGANLSRADLSRADLSGADLTDANLSHCTVDGANFAGATMRQPGTTLGINAATPGYGDWQEHPAVASGAGGSFGAFGEWLKEGVRVLYTHCPQHMERGQLKRSAERSADHLRTGTVVEYTAAEAGNYRREYAVVKVCGDEDEDGTSFIPGRLLVPLATYESSAEGSDSESE